MNVDTVDILLNAVRKVLLVDDPIGVLIVEIIGLLTVGSMVIAVGIIVTSWWERFRIRKVARLDFPDRDTLLKKYRRGVLGSRLALLEQAREQRQVIDQEALSAIARSQLEGSFPTQFVRYVASILIVIGLLGTFIGFGKIVVKVQEILTSVSKEAGVREVMEQIRVSLGQLDEAMSGLTTAFATSVAGVIGTILVSFTCLGIDVAKTGVLRDLESVTFARLMPLFSSDAEATIVRMFGTFEEHTETLSQGILRFNGVIDEGIRSINERIMSVAKETLEKERDLVAQVSEVRGMILKTSTAIATVLEASSNGFADSVQTARRDVKGSVDEIGKCIDALNEALEKASQVLETRVGNAAMSFSSSVESSGAQFSSHVENGARFIVGGSRAAHSTLVGIGQSFKEGAEQAAKALTDELERGGLTLSSRIETAAANLLEVSKQGGAEILNAGRETLAPLPGLINQWKEATETQQAFGNDLLDSLTQLKTAMSDTDRRILELNVDGRSFVEVLSEFAKVMMARETNLQASQILFDEWLGKAAEALAEVTRNLGGSITSEMSGLQNEVRQVGARLQSTTGEVQRAGSQVDHLVRELQHAAQRLETAQKQRRRPSTITPDPPPRLRRSRPFWRRISKLLRLE